MLARGTNTVSVDAMAALVLVQLGRAAGDWWVGAECSLEVQGEYLSQTAGEGDGWAGRPAQAPVATPRHRSNPHTH